MFLRVLFYALPSHAPWLGIALFAAPCFTYFFYGLPRNFIGIKCGSIGDTAMEVAVKIRSDQNNLMDPANCLDTVTLVFLVPTMSQYSIIVGWLVEF